MLHRDLRPWRNRSRVSHSVARSGFTRRFENGAFTLAELLIVIAIIGVLISILLPTLGSARRAANSAKCLAALRDMGLAFQQYAQENKRAFPIVEYSPPAAFITPAGAPLRRTWQDYLVKYIHKRDPNGDLGPYKGTGSVLWGCPNYEADTFYQPAIDPGTSVSWIGPNKFNTGYGMHRYVLSPYQQSYKPPAPTTPPVQSNGTSMSSPGNLAIIRDGAVYGQYYKMEKWGTRAAERGLLADSNTFDIVAATTWTGSAPYGTGTTERRCEPFMNNTIAGNSYISVDGVRHVAPGSNIKKVMTSKGVNMLYVDGHANSVTPEEAWVAIRGGGVDVKQ